MTQLIVLRMETKKSFSDILKLETEPGAAAKGLFPIFKEEDEE